MKKTFSILICALNEEKNIGNILNDILRQKFKDDFDLEKIIIVSDGSTDKTNTIIKECQTKNEKIKLLVNPKRIGKSLSLNVGINETNSDFLILMDADVRIFDDKTLLKILEDLKENNLVFCYNKPLPSNKKTFNYKLGLVGHCLTREFIDFQNKRSFFVACGCLMGLNKRLYKLLKIPDIPGNDQFIYFSCIKNNLRVFYEEKAIVYYKIPEKFKDHLKQKKRAMQAIEKNKKIFGNNFVNNEVFIPFKSIMLISLKIFLKHPIGFLCWIVAFFTSLLKFIFVKNKVDGKWDISETTK